MRMLAVVLAGLVVACAASPPPVSTSLGAPATTPTDASTGTTSTLLLPSVTATTPIDVAVVYLAVVDAAMEGTSFEGYAIDEPEDVLIVGQVFCELRDAGYTEEEALTLHLEGLAELRDLTEEDALFAGTVMGAAFETLCPTTE